MGIGIRRVEKGMSGRDSLKELVANLLRAVTVVRRAFHPGSSQSDWHTFSIPKHQHFQCLASRKQGCLRPITGTSVSMQVDARTSMGGFIGNDDAPRAKDLRCHTHAAASAESSAADLRATKIIARVDGR